MTQTARPPDGTGSGHQVSGLQPALAARAAVLERGDKGSSFHLDGFGPSTDNVSIPGFVRLPQLPAIEPPLPGAGALFGFRLRL